jgi:tetratricopeptide (TPR) repeat protein
MKFRITLMLAAATLVAGAAQAQTIVSRGVGLSHDCYIYAKLAHDLRGGVDICTASLKEELLGLKDQAATHDNRGVLLDDLGKVEEAAEDFHAAIRLDPNLGDPYVNLGSMLIKQHQYEAALTHINKGLDLGASFPHIGYYDRAVAEEMMGRFKEAYYDYKKVLELEPGYDPATERLKDFIVTTVPAQKPG